MKKAFLFVPVLVLAFACQAEQEDPKAEGNSVETLADEAAVRFYASFESSDADSRVYVNEALKVRWNAGDQVSIFAKNTANRQFAFQGEDGDNAGYFEEVNASGATGDPLSYNYAVYPYAETTSISTSGAISVTLPQEQAYRAGSFGLGANTMVSVTEDNVLLFKNVGTYMTVSLYGDDLTVTRITLQGKAREKLSGQATVEMVLGEAPAIAMGAGENVFEPVSIVCAEPVAIGTTAEAATVFWFVLPPTDFTAGFTITVEDGNGNTYVKSTGKRFNLTRNRVLQMAAFELTPLGFGIYPVDGDGYVYDMATDQMNIYEAEGKVWFRFLRVSDPLVMYELGPIPADAVPGTAVEPSLTVVTNGVSADPVSYALTVQSVKDGVMNLASAAGDRFVIRF